MLGVPHAWFWLPLVKMISDCCSEARTPSSTKLTRFLKEEGVLASLQQSLIILTSLLPPVNDIYEFLSRGFLKSTTLGC